MKNLLFLLVLVPFVSFGQNKVDSTVFKGAKSVIIETGTSAKESYLKLANLLLDNGYEIENKDNDLFTIESKDFGTPSITPVYVGGKKGFQLVKSTKYIHFNIRAGENKATLELKIRRDVKEYGNIHYLVDPPIPNTFDDVLIAFAKKMEKPLLFSN